jgi:hypothetical protein
VLEAIVYQERNSASAGVLGKHTQKRTKATQSIRSNPLQTKTQPPFYHRVRGNCIANTTTTTTTTTTARTTLYHKHNETAAHGSEIIAVAVVGGLW